MNYSTGQTISCPFTVRANGALHDPATLQVSFLKSATVEDVITYGGTSPRDSWLSRTSVGTYSWRYTLDVAGEWRIRERWSDDGFITGYKGEDTIVNVVTDAHVWADIPTGPGGLHRVYYGTGVAGIVDTATIELMNHADQTSYDFTTLALAPSAEKVYIAFPSSWQTPSITLDGIACDMLAVSVVLLHDYDSSLVSYDLYETTNLLTDASVQFVVSF